MSGAKVKEVEMDDDSDKPFFCNNNKCGVHFCNGRLICSCIKNYLSKKQDNYDHKHSNFSDKEERFPWSDDVSDDDDDDEFNLFEAVQKLTRSKAMTIYDDEPDDFTQPDDIKNVRAFHCHGWKCRISFGCGYHAHCDTCNSTSLAKLRGGRKLLYKIKILSYTSP